MSWFFGKKKQKDSPPDTPSNEPSSSNQNDDYIFVEKRSNLYPAINDEGAENFNSGLYPPIRGGLPYPAPAPSLTKQSSTTDFHNIINDIPFKLCPRLEKSMNNDLDIDTLRINEISHFIERIKSSDSKYDFNVENSVISEMNSQTEDQ